MPCDEYMQRALQLAEKGRGFTRTNPLVGAVIVKNGRVIAEGYHRAYGDDHAEVDALQNADESVAGADLYVNLEPCAHFGKTPPCVDAIQQAGIKRVFVAMVDPNPQVNGAGIERLRAAGIDVVLGVGEPQARVLNESYLKFVRTGLPFVTLKIAQTLDGKIADCSGNSKWITSLASRQRVHELRGAHDAVLVGANTVRIDNPELTTHGQGRDPLRLVVADHANFDSHTKIFNGALRENTVLCVPTASLNGHSSEMAIWPIAGDNGQVNLRELLRTAATHGIASVLVEGGRKIFSQFIAGRLADKIIFVVAPKLMGAGIAATDLTDHQSIEKALNFETRTCFTLDGDVWIETYPRN